MNAIFNREKTVNKVLSIHIDQILPNPYQPRKIFDEEELSGLSESIRSNGVLQPLSVRRTSCGNFEIIAGERRFRACKQAGLAHVPCIVIDVDEQKSAILAILENIQRHDLSFFEQAEGIMRLIEEWGVTQEEAALRLGKAQSTIANKLRLLKIPPYLRHKIMENSLTERHARALLKFDDPKQMGDVLDIVIARKLNVMETDQLIAEMLQPKKQLKRANRIFIVKDVKIFLNTVEKAIDIMKQSGIAAQSQRMDHEDYIEYTIRIPNKAPRIRRQVG
ncbi:MAG: ParB/RepB/Spo0J family partition protein [Oscillospiraceae bacterium]